MRRRPLWLIGCAISVTLGGSVQEPRRNDIVQLLHANQGIDLGAPAGAAESTSSLLYLQRFQSSEAIVNSVERHADGTAYASYTTPLGPDWYDVARADDAEDTRERVIPAGRGVRRFSDVRAANVNDARWLPPDRAFPPGRGPAPRWVTIHLPLIPRATTPLARSGDYCSRDVVSVLEPLLSLFDPNAGPLARRQAGARCVPPARSSAAATLEWRRNSRTIAQRLSVDEQAQPADSPNHLHLTIPSNEPWQPLVTEDWNEVEPHPTRRLAAKYRLWWSTRSRISLRTPKPRVIFFARPKNGLSPSP